MKKQSPSSNPRRLLIEEIPTSQKSREGDPVVLEVKLFYDAAGANYFTGKVDPRGYYLSVTPVTVSKNFRSTTMFSGGKMLLEEASRFSSAKLHSFLNSSQLRLARNTLEKAVAPPVPPIPVALPS